MDGANPPIPLQDLLAHRAWVRRVACALVADENAADDLEQEVWLRALESPPREARSPRGWLGTVLRRLSTDRWRSEGARARREAAAARPATGEPPRDLVAEAEVHRRLVDAVLALPEPARTTVLRRYFEDLPAAEIARRDGVPVETVRTRLKRAVASLRERLDGEHGGDRRAWVLLVAPLAARPLLPGEGVAAGGGAAAAGAAGALLMAMKAKVAIAAGVLLAAGAAFWMARDAGRTTEPGRSPEQAGTASIAAAGSAAASAAPAEAEAPIPALPAGTWSTRLEIAVRDTRGAAVKGAAVSIAAPPGATREGAAARLHPPSLGTVVARGETDRSGACALAAVPAGPWVLSVAAPGFPRRFEDLRLVEGQDAGRITVVLLPGCTLEGTVRRTDGRILPGVAVIATRPWEGGDRGFDRVTGTADAEGRYRLADLEPGTHDLLVPTPDGVLRGGGCVRVPDVARHDIVLAGGCALRGRVVDDATGNPVAGAAVSLRVAPNRSREGWDGGRDAFAETLSGPDGGFAFEDIPPGFLGDLAARAEGYRDYPDPRFDLSLLRTVFSAGLEVRREVRLRHGASIRGIVTDPEGKPVAGASVTFSSFWTDRHLNGAGRHESPAVVTGADGAYRIDGARSGVGILDVRAEGLALPGVTPAAWERVVEGAQKGNDAIVEVPVAGEVVRDLRLAAMASIEGICVDPAGTPVPGVRLSLTVAEAGSRGFRLAAEPEGSGFAYSGKPAGDRGASAWLAAGGAGEAVADGGGGFRLTGIRPGIHVVVVGSGPGGRKGWSSAVDTVAGSVAREVRVVVEPGAILTGRLTRADGRPLARPLVRLVEGMHPRTVYMTFQPELNRQWAPAVAVAADGSFRAEGLEPGGWQIEAEDEGCARALSVTLDLKAGETREGVEFVLPAERVLAGTVKDPEGNAIPGVEVLALPAVGSLWQAPITIRGSDGTSMTLSEHQPLTMLFLPGLDRGTSATTDAEGRFRCGALGAGKHHLSFRAAGFAESALEIESGSEDLAVVLPPALALAGRVVEVGSGEPVAGLLVSAAPFPWPKEGWPYRDCTTAPDGSFRIGNLAPGRYDLSLGRGDGDLETNCIYQRTPPVDAGTLDLVLEVDRGATIEGRVVDEAGAPVTWGAKVSAWMMPGAEGPGAIYTARVDPDGEFRAMVKPGSYELRLEPESTPFGTAPIMNARLPDVASGSKGLILVARRGAVISGTVLFPKDPSIQRWTALPPFVRPSGAEGDLR